jgi:TRAP-type C4-dicarboxylate transport system permease small subunit
LKRITLLLSKLLELFVTVCVAVLVLVVLWGVLSRFIVSVPSRWTEELATHLLAWVALLGGAVGFKQRQHLGVDYFVNKLHPEAQRFNAIVVQFLVILFAVCVMVGGGSVLAIKTFSTGQVTPAIGLRMGLVYLSVPISGLFIVLFAIDEICDLVRNHSTPSSSESMEP